LFIARWDALKAWLLRFIESGKRALR
jgi:hypothetical protein